MSFNFGNTRNVITDCSLYVFNYFTIKEINWAFFFLYCSHSQIVFFVLSNHCYAGTIGTCNRHRLKYENKIIPI